MAVEHRVFWAERRAVVAFGVLTVAFWLSRAVFPQALPPLAPMPDFGGLVAEASTLPERSHSRTAAC